MVRSTAAVASAIAHNPEADNICLIAGDLSGIQKFIYTISSDGALKSLRARSFYLELVAEEIVQQLLEKLNLPRTSVIYAGGGNFYLLAPATENTKTVVQEVQTTFNKWLLGKFQAKIFLALAVSEPFPVVDVANAKFAEYWDSSIKVVNQQKSRKFLNEISGLLKPKLSYEQRCRVCHRDDTPNLKEGENEDGELIIQCPTCQKMFQLGSQLFKTQVVVRSRRKDIPSKIGKISFQFTHYYLFENQDSLPQLQEKEIVFYINNWQTQSYRLKNSVSLLLGNYAQEKMRAGELAEKSKGIKRVGYLRMDVDNLGKIFAKGLGNKYSLPRLAGLSRQMSYFFKTYLNSLAKNRDTNFIESLKNAKYLTKEFRWELVFIYAGGDDLFISGAWNQVVEFAFDVYQAFRAYTGYNLDITLSGGISINDVKFPLYQAASESGEAEEAAKGNGRDSLGLFGEVFKWGEWVNITDQREDKSKVIEGQKERYLSQEAKPEISDVVSFIQVLTNKLDISSDYSRSFIRRLLDAAATQEQILKQMDKDREKEENKNGVRYYLHLPKLAYALSRLPKSLHDDKDFIAVRQSLMNPRNAPYFRAIATWIELLTRSR
jgi:CRISPR-associated protein Csm1